MRAADLRLTDGEIAALDRLTRPEALYPNWYEAKTLDALTADALQ
jgi:hypothetical protein